MCWCVPSQIVSSGFTTSCIPTLFDHLERVRTLRRIGDRQVLDRDRQLCLSSEEGHGAESEDRLLLRSREQGVPEQPEARVGIVLDGDAQPVVLDAAFHHGDGERVDRVLVAVDRQLFQRRECSVPPIGNGERIDHRHDRRVAQEPQSRGRAVADHRLLVGERRDERSQRARRIDRRQCAGSLRSNGGDGIGESGLSEVGERADGEATHRAERGHAIHVRFAAGELDEHRPRCGITLRREDGRGPRSHDGVGVLEHPMDRRGDDVRPGVDRCDRGHDRPADRHVGVIEQGHDRRQRLGCATRRERGDRDGPHLAVVIAQAGQQRVTGRCRVQVAEHVGGDPAHADRGMASAPSAATSAVRSAGLTPNGSAARGCGIEHVWASLSQRRHEFARIGATHADHRHDGDRRTH